MPPPLLAVVTRYPWRFQVTGERGARLAVFVDDEYVFLCRHLRPSGAHCHERRKEFHPAQAVTFRNTP